MTFSLATFDKTMMDVELLCKQQHRNPQHFTLLSVARYDVMPCVTFVL